MLPLAVNRKCRCRKSRRRKRPHRDRDVTVIAKIPIHGRAAIRAEPEFCLTSFIPGSHIFRRPPAHGHLRTRKSRLHAKNAPCPLLAGQAMAHRNPHRLPGALNRKLPTAARSASIHHELLWNISEPNPSCVAPPSAVPPEEINQTRRYALSFSAVRCSGSLRRTFTPHAAPAPPKRSRRTLKPPTPPAVANLPHGAADTASQNATPPPPTAPLKNSPPAPPAAATKTSLLPAVAPRRPQFVSRSNIPARRNATCFKTTGPKIPAHASATANGKKCAPSQLVRRSRIPFASPIKSVLNK